MKKTIVFILSLTIVMSLVGCSQKDSSTKDQKAVAVQSEVVTKTPAEVVNEKKVAVGELEQSVKDYVTRLNKFKGDGSPNNVKALYNEIKSMLSPEVQNIYERDNVPNTTSASHFKSNEIIEITNVPSMAYSNKQYNGYTVKCNWLYTNDSDGTVGVSHSTTNVINYSGKLLVISDKDIYDEDLAPKTKVATNKVETKKQVPCEVISYTNTDINVKIYHDIKANETYYIRLHDSISDKNTKPQIVTPTTDGLGKLILNVKFKADTTLGEYTSGGLRQLSVQKVDKTNTNILRSYPIYPLEYSK